MSLNGKTGLVLESVLNSLGPEIAAQFVQARFHVCELFEDDQFYSNCTSCDCPIALKAPFDLDQKLIQSEA
jgi:hypothetical protein